MTIDITDLSISTSSNLYTITQLDSVLWIAGGERFFSADIFAVDVNNLKPQSVTLPVQSTHKAIYDIQVIHNNLVAVGYDGSFYYSNDSGKHWQFTQHNSWRWLQSVIPLSNDSLLIAAQINESKGFIYKTDIKGNGSAEALHSFSFDAHHLYTWDSSTIFLVGYGACMYSHDKGKNFSFTMLENDYFVDIEADAKQLIAIGYEGTIATSNNSGQTWKKLRNANNILQGKKRLLGIHHAGDTWIIVGEKGLVWLSKNQGNSWETITPFTGNDLYAVHCINEQRAIVCGQQGALYALQW